MTQTSTYTPTFMENLLGGNYKWWYLITYWIKANSTYFWSEVFVGLNRTIVLLGTCLIFLYLGNENQNEILNYLLLGSVFFSISDPVISWETSGDIKQGKITKWLMYPSEYLHFLFFASIANCLYLSVTALVGIIPVIFAFQNFINFSLDFNLLLLIPLLAISFVVRFGLQTLAGFSSFWFTEGNGSNHLTQSMENFLSGSMFPLFILPAVFSWLEFLPFAFTFYHPMQIYLGNYDTNQALLVLAGGIIWCVVLYFLAKLIFKLGLKRNESVGL